MVDFTVALGIKTLLPVESQRGLAELVHHTLREAITRGDLGPGVRLPEVGLARQLGVSPTPVREAIRSLEREGLVEVSRHRGASVISPTPAEIANLYEMHEVLESYAVGRAAGLVAATRATGTDQSLASAAAVLLEIDAVLDASDQATFNRLDLVFHRTLNVLSENPMLVTTIEQIHRRIQAARIHHDVCLPDRPRKSQAQHRELLEAVRAGDTERAQALAGTHIRSIRDPVLALLRQASEKSDSRKEETTM